MFIKNEIASGRYGSASEVVRDALRTLETRNTRLEARRRLAEGEAQAKAGDFVSGYSVDGLLAQADEAE